MVEITIQELIRIELLQNTIRAQHQELWS